MRSLLSTSYCPAARTPSADPAAVLREAVRVLKPGGRLFIEVPNYLAFYEGHYLVPQPPILWNGMLAFWENADEPNIDVLSPEQERRQHETQAEIAKLEQTFDRDTLAELGDDVMAAKSAKRKKAA